MTQKVTAADVSAEIDLCTPYFRVDKLELAENNWLITHSFDLARPQGSYFKLISEHMNYIQFVLLMNDR